MGNTALPRVGDDELQRLTTLIEQAIQALEKHPLANMRFVTVTFTAGFSIVRVYHGLGYQMTGWFVVSTTSLAQVFNASTADVTDPNNFGLFGANTPATVTLAVF